MKWVCYNSYRSLEENSANEPGVIIKSKPMATVTVPGCPAGEKIDKVVEIVVPAEAEPSLHGTLFSLNHVLECSVVHNTADKFFKSWKIARLDFIVQVAPPQDDGRIILDKHYLAQETPLPSGWNPMVFPL